MGCSHEISCVSLGLLLNGRLFQNGFGAVKKGAECEIPSTASRPEAVRAIEKVAFPDRFQHHLEQHLDYAVFERGDPQRALFAIALGDIDPSYR
jgi:hypothetical protein